MVKGESHSDFLIDLNQKGSGHNGLKARGWGGSPCHRVQLMAVILYRSMVVPVF